jgi:3-polyprenyl-4-hydroxybenzoate decarboxylase
MRALYERIRAELELIRRRVDQRLNVVASLVVGYLVANSAQFQAAVTSLVPAKYQALAGLAAGLLSYLIVRAASARDAKKAAGNG